MLAEVHEVRRLAASSLLLALALVAAAPPAGADRVITTDGRVVTPIKARPEGQGLRLFFEHGEVVLPDRSQIADVEVEGDMSDYVPQNDDEREKLEKGYVRFEGKWMSKPAYLAVLEKRRKQAQARIDELRAHADFADAWELETKHFLVKTNTSPELLEYYADLLEAYYKLMDDRIGIKPTPTYRRKKMTVNIYRSHAEFLEYGKVGPSVLGFFSPVGESLNFFHDYTEPARSDWVALHECTHLLTFLIDQQYQPQIWLNEAVADYFGSSEISTDRRGRLHIDPGKLQLDRTLTVQQAIENDSYVRLEDLFLVDRNHFSGFEYAHAWSFVYFLNNYDDGKYQKGFKKFFKDIYTLAKGLEVETVEAWGGNTGVGKSVPPKEIRRYLLKCIKVSDVAELEQQWKDFVMAIEIDAPEARLKRGIRAMQQAAFADAIEDLDAAIEAGVGGGRAYWARARSKYFTGGGRDAAVPDLDRAIELEPLNPLYRFEKSQMFVPFSGGTIVISGGQMDFRGAPDLSNADPEDVEVARTQAGLAMELDPRNDRYREWFEALQ